MKLAFQAAAKLALGLLLLAAMLFLPAGTVQYFGAWLFFGVLFLPMLLMGAFLLCKAPRLLEKRLNNKEKAKTQRGVVGLSGLMFFATFVVSALDHRFGWSRVPLWLTLTAAAVFLLGYATYAEVMRENAYLSRTVEVQVGQTVVSTGLYGIVRHPMYLATLLMFLPMPLILQSFWGLVPVALYPVVIVVRLLDEEKLLAAELAGYADYQKKVRYRLLPFLW